MVLCEWDAREASPEQAFLHPLHAGRGARGGILETIQVEQPVDDVEREFLVGGVPILARVALRGRGAQDDLAVGESDHVRGAGDAHEVAMHPRDDTVRHDGDLHLRELREGEASVGGFPRALFPSHRREAPQPRELHRHGTLAVFDVDGHAAEAGGSLARGAGTGVSRRSVRSLFSVRPPG